MGNFLTNFLFEHLSDDFLTSALSSSDLPISTGAKLTPIPRENMSLFLEFADDMFVENQDKPGDFLTLMRSQHVPLKFIPLGYDAYTETGKAKMEKTPLIMVNFNPDSLFWQTFNPFLKDQTLSIDFEHAVSKAQSVLNARLYDSGIMSSNYDNDFCILFSDLPEFFNIIRDELVTPSEDSITPTKKDYVGLAISTGFTLKPNVKNKFENFITDPEFKQMLDRDVEWPLKYKNDFLDFFQISDADAKQINLNGTRVLLPTSSASPKLYPDFSFQDVLLANKYTILIIDGQKIMMRQLEVTKQDTHQMGLQSGKAQNRVFTSNCQPINRQEWDLLADLLENTPHQLRIFENYNSNEIDTPMMAMRFLLEPDYITRINNNCPWLKGLGDKQKSVEVLDQFFSDAFSYVVPFGLAGSVIRSTEDLQTAIFLQALQKSKNPETVLSYILYLGSLPSSTGDWIRQTFIPLIFSQIGYDEALEDKDEDHDQSTVHIQNSHKALSNQWANIDASDMPLLAEKLAAFKTKDLNQIVLSIKYDPLTQLQNYGEYTQNQTTIIADSNNLHVGTRSKHEAGRIRIDRILSFVKLDSTQEELKKSFLVQREVSLEDLLMHSWSATEREDLRTALATYYFWTPRSEIEGIESLSAPFSPAPQLEMMSFHALARLIRTSSISDRSVLWEALFNKSPVHALKLFENMVERTMTNGFKEDGSYPSREDLVWATPFVIASQEPLAEKILIKFRSYFEANQITDLLAIKLDGIEFLDFELKDLLAFHSEPSEVYNLFLAVEDLFVSYHRLFGGIKEPYFAQLSKSGLSQNEISYLRALTGDVASPPLTYDTIDAMIILAKQNQNDSNNRIHFLRIWQVIEEDFSGRLDSNTALSLAEYVSDALIKGNFGIDDVAKIIDAILKSGIHLNDLPLTIRLATAALESPLGFENITENELFELNSSGIKTLKDDQNLKAFLQNLRQDNQFLKMQGPLLGLARGVSYNPSSTRIKLLSGLMQKFGEFQMGPISSLKLDWVFAHYYPKNPTQPIDFNFQNVESEVYSALSHFSKLPAYDPVALQIRKNLKQCYETNPEFLGQLTIHKSSFLRVIYPQNILTQDLMSLWRYDQVKYPQQITDADTTGFSTEEIQFYMDNVRQVYSKFLDNLKLFWQLHSTDYPLPENPQVFLDQIPKSDTNSPWFEYSVLLVQALYGDEKAIEQLWLFESGVKQLTSDVAVFHKVSQDLLIFAHKLLMQVDPERFFTGTSSLKIANDSTLAMIELGHPDPSTQALQGHLKNPTRRANEVPLDNVGHATKVAQTLLGNYQDSNEATGQIRSYAVELDGSNWQALDEQFKQFVLDAKADPTLKVINLSYGFFGTSAIGAEYEALTESESYKSIQQSLATLREMNIPVVIAAGNSGTEDNSFLMGTLNWFGALDPAIILVGATNLAGTHSTDFSSKGTASYRADISMIGEDLTFWNQSGGVENKVAGTSFAAPFTARIIAKMRDINPELSVEAIQAILKMSAQDMAFSSPLVEGAGFIDAKSCLYLSFVYGKKTSKEDRAEFAKALGIANQADLDWLAKRIQRQVFWQDTTKQSYGE